MITPVLVPLKKTKLPLKLIKSDIIFLQVLPICSNLGYFILEVGDLILSNSGLLGVVCSCPGIHMSISKFSEVVFEYTSFGLIMGSYEKGYVYKNPLRFILFASCVQHSGLPDVNPGDAVHMDSGETIAQWRKVYLSKFGVSLCILPVMRLPIRKDSRRVKCQFVPEVWPVLRLSSKGLFFHIWIQKI
ncbi:hypothetical protein Hanom_Chr12g01119921 [Helianthus anomalus]